MCKSWGEDAGCVDEGGEDCVSRCVQPGRSVGECPVNWLLLIHWVWTRDFYGAERVPSHKWKRILTQIRPPRGTELRDGWRSAAANGVAEPSPPTGTANVPSS